MASLSVGSERISKIVGYELTKGNFAETSPNLPQRIAILAEANDANQSAADNIGVEYTSAQEAALVYGFGSPIHRIMSILRPNQGDGVAGIPTVVYPQPKAVGSVAKVLRVAPTGTATANGTHTLKISGRTGIDGVFYDINIVTGDDATAVIQKITDAVNAVLGTPVIATIDTTYAVLTAKWSGLTSNEINVSVELNGTDLGITYAVTSPTSGSGTPSVQAALDTFGSAWNTLVVNSYGTVSATMQTLEAFNGKPRNGAQAPTGRYTGIIMKPFVALTGSLLENPSTITDTRLDDLTIAICPAPLSLGFSMEAAANVCALVARTAQDTPELDVNDLFYPDMPTPSNIGFMATYTNRDAIVKKGCSTVDLVNSKYRIMDLITTYHPIGETPPQFRYVRNLFLDFNIRYSYYLLEATNVVNKVISADNDIVTSSNVIKPKQWKQILFSFATSLVQRALIVDASFMTNSITVQIGGVNPDRLDTFFRYKRSGVARISATTAEAGFNFGNV